MIFHVALVVSFKAPLKIEMTNRFSCFYKALMEASFLTLFLRPHAHHEASDKEWLTERYLKQQLAEVIGHCLVSGEAETQTKSLNWAFNGALPASLLFHWKPPSSSLNSDVKNQTWAGNENLPVQTKTLKCWALNGCWSRGPIGQCNSFNPAEPLHFPNVTPHLSPASYFPRNHLPYWECKGKLGPAKIAL